MRPPTGRLLSTPTGLIFVRWWPLQRGLLAETTPKSWPRLAGTAQADVRALPHLLVTVVRSVADLRAKCVDRLRSALGRRPWVWCINKTGVRKKGKTTDQAAHQSLGNVAGLANLTAADWHYILVSLPLSLDS